MATRTKKEEVLIDSSYNIQEIEVDGSWNRDLMTAEYREYREKWDAASNHQRLFEFPLFMEIETSYACNYKCPKCPRQALRHDKKQNFLSNELLDKLFGEVKKHRMPSITFSHGGEPTLRKDLPDLLRKARESCIMDRMFHTNGLLLTKELSRRVIESGLTKVNFSLDAASRETYEKVRVGGDYEKVIANIHGLLEAKREFGKSYPRVRVSFVISEENRHEKKKFFELWKDKVNLIAFQKCYDFTKMTKDGVCKPLGAEFPRHCCSQLWQLLTVTCEGDILICERDYDHEHVLGNLRTHTIYECWQSKEMNRFRELHLKNRWHEIPICRKCVMAVERVKKDEVS